MIEISRYLRMSLHPRLLEILLAARALLFVGTRYTCPCCGWRLRAFTYGGTSLKIRHLGYCPRCNSKARHRRDWLLLEHQTNLFSDRLRLFHVSPTYSLSRRFKSMPNLDYTAGDLYDRANVGLKMDLAATPICSDTFDAIICIHVLEHIQEDCKAIRELFRVLKPGGWALVSVPIRLDEETFEDPAIVAPQDREHAFGEEDHVRIYGHDLINRLEACGFRVRLDLATEIPGRIRNKYGLRQDENVLYCSKEQVTNQREAPLNLSYHASKEMVQDV
jgi:predicted SAM-dependent methyltransferase